MSTLYDIRSGTLVKSKAYTNGLFLKDVINSDITTPSILSVIDYLLKGGGESAVAYAIYELTDGATDWVLDPANNQVKYTQSTGGSGSWTPQVCTFNGYPSFIEAANANCASIGKGTHSSTFFDAFGGEIPTKDGEYATNWCTGGNNVGDGIYLTCSDNPEPEPVPEEKYIPIDTVAAKIIANAEAGHAPSQEAVNNSVII